MSRMCPKGFIALYMDCLECDDKICKLSKKDLYFKHIDTIMLCRGFKRYKTCKDYCLYKTLTDNVYYNFISVKVLNKKQYQFITTVSSDIFDNIKDNEMFWKNIKTLYV